MRSIENFVWSWRKKSVVIVVILLALTILPSAAQAAKDEPAPQKDENGFTVLLGPMPDLNQPRKNRTTADHSKFEQLKDKKFRKTRDVIKACLECHNEGGKQVHKTKHWTWDFTNPSTGQRLGAKNVINNFFMSVTSNEATCSHCHIGTGWNGNKFNYQEEKNVDCLTCHDTTGKYAFKKFHTARGNCAVCHEEIPQSPGDKKHKTNLNEIALNVGPTSRRTCGSCHFMGGGGVNVKHGDLDPSLTQPARELDVHMDAEGLNFSCTKCHTTEEHIVRGSRYDEEINDVSGVTTPGRHPPRRSSCRSCHGDRPMHGDKLNDHTDKIACQTCHIPSIARGGYATKVSWDWSTSGKMGADGKPILVKDAKGNVTFSTHKGDSVWAENLIPEYAWFNGSTKYTLLGDKIDPSKPVPINRFLGGTHDPQSRIWPIKKSRGKQPFDAKNNTLVAVNMFALHRFANDKNAYWRNLDWPKAIAKGMKTAGQDFSGEVGFTATEMSWPVTHMVAPATKALGCIDCHNRNGRLANIPGIYIPSQDTISMVEWLGWGMVFATLGGVILHGSIRIVASRNRRMKS